MTPLTRHQTPADVAPYKADLARHTYMTPYEYKAWINTERPRDWADRIADAAMRVFVFLMAFARGVWLLGIAAIVVVQAMRWVGWWL